MGRFQSCVRLQEERGEALVAGEHGRSLSGAGRDCGWRVRRRGGKRGWSGTLTVGGALESHRL